MPYQRKGKTILARWNDLERVLSDAKWHLAQVAPASDEAERLRDQIDDLISQWASLRVSYQRLIEEAATRRAPALPKWPDPPDPDATKR
jgi:chromosome segregation ATPase